MKILLKLALLASTLLTAATSAYALNTQQIVGYSTINVATVPGPAALGLLGIGIVILALVRRKK